MSKSVPINEIINKKKESNGENNIINDILNDLSVKHTPVVENHKKEQRLMETELQKTIALQQQREQQKHQELLEQQQQEQELLEQQQQEQELLEQQQQQQELLEQQQQQQELLEQQQQQELLEQQEQQQELLEQQQEFVAPNVTNNKSEIRLSSKDTPYEKKFNLMDKLLLYFKHFIIILVITTFVSFPFMGTFITGVVEQREFFKSGLCYIVPIIKGVIVGLLFILFNNVI